MSPVKTSSYDILTPNRADVVAEARSWLETRWVHQGRSRDGIDCAGLVIKVHEGLGLPADDMQGYRRNPNALEFLRHIRRQTVLTLDPRPGSLAVFRQDKFACHIGIIGWSARHDMLTIIHAHAAHKKVVEEPFTADWTTQLVEFRDIIGLYE